MPMSLIPSDMQWMVDAIKVWCIAHNLELFIGFSGIGIVLWLGIGRIIADKRNARLSILKTAIETHDLAMRSVNSTLDQHQATINTLRSLAEISEAKHQRLLSRVEALEKKLKDQKRPKRQGKQQLPPSGNVGRDLNL